MNDISYHANRVQWLNKQSLGKSDGWQPVCFMAIDGFVSSQHVCSTVCSCKPQGSQMSVLLAFVTGIHQCLHVLLALFDGNPPVSVLLALCGGNPPVSVLLALRDGNLPVNSLRASNMKSVPTWRRHQMETFSALLALYAGNSPVTDEFPSQRPVTELWCFLWSSPE